MQSKNVSIANPFIGQSPDALISNILHAIETLGRMVTYYSYDEDAEEFRAPVTLPAYLQNIEDKNFGAITVDKSYDIIFSSKSFYDNNIVPDENDKYVYSDETYYVSDPQFINSFHHTTDILDNSVLVTFISVKRTSLKRTQI